MAEFNKPVVAHFVQTYLFLTGSWIYNQLNNQRKFIPIVIARRLENLDKFPIPKERIYQYRELITGQSMSAALIRKAHQIVTKNRKRFYVHILRQINAQIIHAHFGTEGYFALQIKKELGIPLVTTFYGSDMSKLPLNRPSWRSRYLKLFAHGDLFLCEGEHMALKVQQLGCPSEKIRIHHLGIDLNKIKYTPRSTNGIESIRLVIASSFREKKGIPYAIEAFAKAVKIYPKMELRIIGGAKDRPAEISIFQQCKQIVQEKGIDKNVHFLGYIPYAEYLEEMRKAHIFLAPSVTAKNGDTEGGAPVSIIEASGAGLPIISTWHCDIPGVVLHERSGLLVQERNSAKLAEAILYLANNPNQWKLMGATGRKHIEQKFDVQKQTQHLEKIIYTKLLRERGLFCS